MRGPGFEAKRMSCCISREFVVPTPRRRMADGREALSTALARSVADRLRLPRKQGADPGCVLTAS